MLICYVVLASLLISKGMSLKFLLITYNTGNTNPEEDTTALLGLSDDPDLISIGFEELGDTSSWEKEVDEILSRNSYYRVKLITLSIMQQCVYAKKKHLPHISHVETEYTKTGFAGTYGNKGGTSVRFRLYDKTVAVVNSHLSAHLDQVLIRDEEYWNIMTEQDFDDPVSKHLYDHDYLFWTGDLNYRIEHDNKEVRATIEAGKHLDLMQYDQLQQEQSAGHAFIGFHEADISFPPTYKFDPGTDVYDTSEKKRTPSWCDRVLWRIKAEREEIVDAVHWGYESSDSLSDLSMSSSDAEVCEVDGACVSKTKKQEKKSKKKECEVIDYSNNSLWENMRRKTVSLMKKTATYAAATGNAILRTATVTAPIMINKADVADPERFKDLLSTLERKKVSIIKHKYENAVRPLHYKSHPEYKKSDHKPVSALLEISVNVNSPSLVRFAQSQYTWKNGEKLSVSLEVFEESAHRSSWDWVALLEPNWTDPNAQYLTYQYFPSDKLSVSLPWEYHPGLSKSLVLVFVSSRLRTPLAVTDVMCL